MDQLVQMISEKAESIHQEVIEIRRDIHQHPELSGKESRTAGLVAGTLKKLGLEVRTGVGGGHGVVGILRGKTDQATVALRADMDAIPQDLVEEVPFKSLTSGVSHGCGHDVHTATALGVARVLSSIKEKLPGTVVFIFQPSEENIEGARQMIAAGVLDDPKPQAIFAFHVAPLETGKIAALPGVGLPGILRFSVELSGEDEITARAADVLVESIRGLGNVGYPQSDEEAVQYFSEVFIKESRLSSFILAQAWIDEESTNEKKIVRGFFKASSEANYTRSKKVIEEALGGFEGDGIVGTVSFEKSLPDMFCDQSVSMESIPPIEAILGRDSVEIAHNSLPFFGEDFTFYLEKIPGAMFFLGASNEEKGITAFPHAPVFSVDEQALLIGVKSMSSVIVHHLFRLAGK